jgi:hypothetical protein
MDNNFVLGMEILINCKHLVEDLLAEKKRLLKHLETSGKLKQAQIVQAQIDRLQRVLNGERPYRPNFHEQE